MSSTDVHVHVHRDPPAVAGSRDRMGVVLLIVADIAFVLCLMFTYLYLRFLNVKGLWLPDEITPAPSGPTWVVVVVLFIGAVAFAWGARSLRAARPGPFAVGSWVAVAASIVALVVQIQQLFGFNFALQENGRYLSAYSSSMVALAGANAFHIMLTAFIAIGIANRTRLGRYEDPESWQPRIATYWWTWVVVSAALVGLMTTFLVTTPFPPSMG
jgi:heme/copper-type cytochrome/quinol oxidase subunit 3